MRSRAKNHLTAAIQQVQQLIAHETGSPLSPAGEGELREILRQLQTGQRAGGKLAERFASRQVTIMLADLRGFSAIAENYPIDLVLELLNRYLARMSEVIGDYGGQINKFMGDSIMILFWDHDSENNEPDTSDAVQRAIRCAVDMQIAMGQFNADHREHGVPELFMGIGINTGGVMAGLVGNELYSEFTVIGDEVNLASRIEAFSLRGQVLISESTYTRCQDDIRTGAPMEVCVKGKTGPVLLREVLGIPTLGKEVPRREIRNSPRVKADIPFRYQEVHNKIVMPVYAQGTILDIGYHGIKAELSQPLPPNTEIRFDVDLPFIGRQASDIYAKILRTKEIDGRSVVNVEFTSIDVQSSANIKYFVQMLVQSMER
jgi:adenylate cyclase